MKVSVVKIGNSKGIRFSKTIINKYKIKDTVELILEEEQMVIKPVVSPREGWEKAFAEMTNNGDNKLLCDVVFEDENIGE